MTVKKGGNPSSSGPEKTWSTSICSGHLRASSIQACSPSPLPAFHHMRAEGNTRELFSLTNKNHQFQTISERGTVKGSACVGRGSAFCIPGKHPGHTTGDLMHFNCTSWDEEIKQKRFFCGWTESWRAKGKRRAACGQIL